MIAELSFSGSRFKCDFSKPIDISIPLRSGEENPKAWYAPNPDFSPVETENFIGSVAKGAPVNFHNVFFNPHGNGTHTESAGHVLKEMPSINHNLKTYFFIAELISVNAEVIGGDHVIKSDQIKMNEDYTEAVIIRTLPNSRHKLNIDYSGSNPPYIDPEAIAKMVDRGIKHLLIDTPSVDREEDDGALSAHHKFWDTKGNVRLDCTISEMIFVPDEVEDGQYLLNLMIAPFELDASPSKPILYKLEHLTT